MFRRSIILFIVLIALAAARPGSMPAEKLYRSVDEKGTVGFSDRQLSGSRLVKVRQVEKELPDRRFFVQLRGTRRNGTLYAVNQYSGPIEVQIEMLEQNNIMIEPSLPARFVVPGRSEMPTIEIRQQKKYRSFSYRYSYSVVFGDPDSQHAPTRPYRMPVPAGRLFRISQAFNGSATHHDEQNRFAIDIPMAEGTPVHAARSGIIMDVADDFFSGGTDDEALEQKANYVRILHDDGTMAVYAHLKLETLQFPLGTRVRRGQMIALSGNTGYSTGPHLHFVLQKNDGMKLVSIPFVLAGIRGEVVEPRAGIYLAAN